MKRRNVFPTQSITISTLPAPKANPYLVLPADIEDTLQHLLHKPDFKVLDEKSITRYQHDFKELQVSNGSNILTRSWERETFLL